MTYGWPLYLSLQPVLQLRQRTRTMGKRVLLCFVHFGVCLAFIFEDRIPACISRSATLSSSPPLPPLQKKYKIAYIHTKISRTPRRHYLPLQHMISQPNGGQISRLTSNLQQPVPQRSTAHAPAPRSTQTCKRLGRICLRMP